MTIYPSLTKICSKCKLSKELDEFHRNKARDTKSLQEAINYLNKYKHG